jgi:hypothetical protein
MREYGLLKIDNVKHHVAVELVRPVECRAGRESEQKARSKPFALLRSRKG